MGKSTVEDESGSTRARPESRWPSRIPEVDPTLAPCVQTLVHLEKQQPVSYRKLTLRQSFQLRF